MFNLSFINSFFLYGILLAAAPIIIHLVNKKKAVSLKFPTIRFIVESNKRVAKKFRLRQILLLILRTLAILFLIFIFARPLVRSEESMVDYAALSRGTVVIVDNSSSMLYRGREGTFFNAAISSAESIIVNQKNIDSAAVMTTCYLEEGPMPNLSFKKLEVLETLKDIKVNYTRNRVVDTLHEAIDVLKESNAQVREIYFVSDMQRTGWGDEDSYGDGIKRALKENDINVYLVDIAPSDKINNVGIVSVAAFKQSKGKVSVLNIFSKIKSFAKDKVSDLLVKSFVSEKEAVKGFVDIDPYEVTEKDFFTPIDESGIITGHVKLKGDSFSPDDVRYFSLKSYRIVRVLVVDGDPTSQVFNSETYYLSVGLNPLKDSYSKIESHIVTTEAFKKESLKDYDVIFLCNVEGVEKTRLVELRRFVKEGGGLIFTLGDKVDPQKYNSTFGDLLPQKIRDIYSKVQMIKGKPFEYINVKEYAHPILTPFEGAGNGDLSTVKFYKYFVLQPSVESQSNTVLEYSSGNPCIVEKRYYKGNVLMFTSTADRGFNDMCIYPTYLPLMQQITLYAANALGREAYTELVIEDTAQFSVDKEIADVTIQAPEGELFYEQPEARKEVAEVTFSQTYTPGFYKVYDGKLEKGELDGKDPVNIFAVNVNTDESDFAKVDETMLEKIFAKNFSYIKKTTDMDKIDLKHMRGEEVWSKLIIYLILFLFLESIISSTWRKRKKVKAAQWKEEGYNL